MKHFFSSRLFYKSVHIINSVLVFHDVHNCSLPFGAFRSNFQFFKEQNKDVDAKANGDAPSNSQGGEVDIWTQKCKGVSRGLAEAQTQVLLEGNAQIFPQST